MCVDDERQDEMIVLKQNEKAEVNIYFKNIVPSLNAAVMSLALDLCFDKEEDCFKENDGYCENVKTVSKRRKALQRTANNIWVPSQSTKTLLTKKKIRCANRERVASMDSNRYCDECQGRLEREENGFVGNTCQQSPCVWTKEDIASQGNDLA